MRLNLGLLVASVSFLGSVSFSGPMSFSGSISPVAAGADGGMDDPGPCYARNPDPMCDPSYENPCWNPNPTGGDLLTGNGGDECNDPPPLCDPGTSGTYMFFDDMDGNMDGQLMVLAGDNGPACGRLTVDTTGYYNIFDIAIAESGDTQQNETGYLTIANSCNTDGWPEVHNVGPRFVVLDADNMAPPCMVTADCPPGVNLTCANDRCVPAAVFMGTFLLVADEDNIVCLHHWCPEYLMNPGAGFHFGDANEGSGCGTNNPNSIHFIVDPSNAIACVVEDIYYQCAFGCYQGACDPDPCVIAACPDFCMDGICFDEDQCAAITCENGCTNGYCLPPVTGDPNGEGTTPPNEPKDPGIDLTGDGCCSCRVGGASVSPVHAPAACVLALLALFVRIRRKRRS